MVGLSTAIRNKGQQPAGFCDEVMIMKTRIHRKGLGSLSSFSLSSQVTQEEIELLKKIKSSYSSHTPRRTIWPANQ